MWQIIFSIALAVAVGISHTTEAQKVVNAPSKAVVSAPEWTGVWHYSRGAASSELRVRNVSKGKMPFALNTQLGGNTGEVIGEATLLSATVAVYCTADCELRFILTTAGLEVKMLQSCGMGLNVDASGKYTRSKTPLPAAKPRYPLTEAGLLPSKAAEDILRASKYYERYARITQEIVEPDDCTTPHWVRQGHIPGLLSACIVLVQPERVQAAIIDYDEADQEVIYYFDSADEPVSVMPECLTHWCAYYTKGNALYDGVLVKSEK